jgi:transcriptional regulator with XRE-family HTH domain
VKADQLIAWRHSLASTRRGQRHLSALEAAQRLGVSRTAYRGYEAGTQPIPITVALACAALSHGLPPIGGSDARA